MGNKIQLNHPAGKKAISMDKEKYNVIEKSVLVCLKVNGESTHSEILKSITEDFNRNNTPFKGSIEWHLEWVKLDLEARKVIVRISGSSPIKFKLA
jgi:hypothetical protein